MAKKVENEFVFEDISSSSKSQKAGLRKSANDYGNGAIKHLDKVIKAISFIVALMIAAIFFIIAAVVVTLDASFKFIGLAIVIVGIILALICLFLIYGLGHIITQNKQILRRL